MPPCGTFDYVAVVPDSPTAFAAAWAVALREPVRRVGDRLVDDRLVGYTPTLRIADAGAASDVPRSRITLTAARRRGASIRAATFDVARGLVSALRPRDVLHMARTGCGAVGLSVIRDGRLVAAVGAVDAVPLGSLVVRVPPEAIAERQAMRTRRAADMDVGFDHAAYFRALPVELIVEGRRHTLEPGECELGDYDVYLAHGFILGTPGRDMCVAVSLKGACPAVAVNASAQLLDGDALSTVAW